MTRMTINNEQSKIVMNAMVPFKTIKIKTKENAKIKSLL